MAERLNRRKLTVTEEQYIVRQVETQPGLLLHQIGTQFQATHGKGISPRLLSKIMKRHGITRKRGTRLNVRYVVERGRQFLQDVRSIFTPLMASIDECSVMLNSAPTYGWAPRGQRAVIRQPGKMTVSYSLLLCISPVGVLNWSLRSGTIDSEIFSQFSAKLPNDITVLLDNSRIHHATKALTAKGLPTVAELARSKTMTLKYTPPYAPHLNSRRIHVQYSQESAEEPASLD